MMSRFIFLFLFVFALVNSSCSDPRSETDKLRGKIISQFSKQMKKKGLHAIGCGGGASNGKINLVDVCFSTDQPINIENGRELIVFAADSLLEIINSCEEQKEYFIQFPVPVDLIKVAIISELQGSDPDSICYASIFSGNIHYCRENSDMAPFENVHLESFAEAQAILSSE